MLFRSSRTLEEQALAMLLQQPALAAHVSAELATFFRQELADGRLLLEVWESIRASAPQSTAALLERWRDQPPETPLSALAAIDLNIAESALESEFLGALTRLRQKGEEQRFRRINAIPFEQWTDEQREIVRNHKRTK